MSPLFQHAMFTIFQSALEDAKSLEDSRKDIRNFEEICAVLRDHGHEFTESLEMESGAVFFEILPSNHDEYLAIMRTMAVMGAIISSGGIKHTVIDNTPDVPRFFLINPLHRKLAEVRHA